MLPPYYQPSTSKPSFLLALVCAAIVSAYDRTWLARPVCELAAKEKIRPERLSRLKAQLLGRFESLLQTLTRRGRPKSEAPSKESRRAPVLAALLAVATRLLAECRIPFGRRAIQDRLVCAYDRLSAEHQVTVTEFCEVLAIPLRTFRFWRNRSPDPPKATELPPAPPPPKPDRANGRFALEVTAPGTQLGADTQDLQILGVPLKLVAAQDIGARQQRLWEAFTLNENETADLVASVVQQATHGLTGFQLITDQGKPYIAEAAKEAYDKMGVEHAPQREGSPTQKATVERAFLTAQTALAPIWAVLNRLAAAIPSLRQPELAKAVGTLLIAVFLRVYATGRQHLTHPLSDGRDPDLLRAIIEEQRDKARADDRSVRLFLERMHADYAIEGAKETFVRRFKTYPLEDLREAERQIRAYACRCQMRICDRYFAATLRRVHEQAKRRRAAARAKVCVDTDQRHAARAGEQRLAELNAHPERRLFEGLDILAQTWDAAHSRFLANGEFAKLQLRLAIADIYRQDALTAKDRMEAHFRNWLAGAKIPYSVSDSIREVMAQLFTKVQYKTEGGTVSSFPFNFIAAINHSSAATDSNNLRPP